MLELRAKGKVLRMFNAVCGSCFFPVACRRLV